LFEILLRNIDIYTVINLVIYNYFEIWDIFKKTQLEKLKYISSNFTMKALENWKFDIISCILILVVLMSGLTEL